MSNPIRFPGPLLACLLAACSTDAPEALTESVAPGPWRETLVAPGEVKAVDRTLIKVPGANWEQRRLLWLKPDGARVEKDELLARFDAPEARLKYDQASLELLRTALKQAETRATADVAHAALQTELAQVDTDLAISTRYADADVGAFARNQILDAVQDLDFLRDKKDFLGWRQGQSEVREASARAVVQAQGETTKQQVDRARQSLSALEVRAPNAGVFKLIPNWDGTKPQAGSGMWASEEFAEIPNEASMRVEFTIPQAQAAGLAPGLKVLARFAGIAGDIPLELSRVGANASPRDRRSPVKYVDLEAMIPEAVVREHRIAPGQAVRGEIVLVDEPSVLSVPNMALEQEGTQMFVRVAGREPAKVAVTIGRRGQARSEVTAGLAAGDEILLAVSDSPAQAGGDGT